MAKLDVITEKIPDNQQKQVVLLGNAAIARGVIEAGVQRCFTYPGTPSSEIMGILTAVASKVGYYAEYSTNEKTALEGAFASAQSGLRAFYACKHVGVNVAADVLMTIAYSGVEGGLIILSADDPAMHSSQNEQDTRWYSLLSHMICVEPSDAIEAKEFIKMSYELSEHFKVPILFRTTTRISHSRVTVPLKPIPKNINYFTQGKQERIFEKDPSRWVCLPMNARKNKTKLIKKFEEIRQWVEKSNFNRLEGSDNGEIAFIVSGGAYPYLIEALDQLKMRNAPLLKIGIVNPLPERTIKEFLTKHPIIGIVEEGDNVLEIQIRDFAQNEQLTTKILGKKQGLTPMEGEMNIMVAKQGIERALGKPITPTKTRKVEDFSHLLLARPPVLCPGCPHRGTFYAINKATKNKKNAIISTDIGCYTLGFFAPLNIGDSCVCMGASIGVGHGLSLADLKHDIISIIGDSTFWHTGLSALANALYNKANLTIIILDNYVTAMTGMQENPSSGYHAHGTPTKPLDLVATVKGIGVEFVEVINAFQPDESQQVIQRAIEHKGVSVIISQGICQIRKRRLRSEKKEALYHEVFDEYYVDPDLCRSCGTCINKFGCPAISWSETVTNSKGKPVSQISPIMCDPCGVCTIVCPFDAIKGRNKED